jgi:hypothetical protein
MSSINISYLFTKPHLLVVQDATAYLNQGGYYPLLCKKKINSAKILLSLTAEFAFYGRHKI